MTEHILLPHVNLAALQLVQQHREWLSQWLSTAERDIENEDVSASLCLQGMLSEVALYGVPQTDWCGVMAAYLTDADGIPLAYSEQYGKRLYRFNFWLQSPVHAVHCRWFIERICLSVSRDAHKYADYITENIQPSGWIYNPDVSPTRQRHRMKSEYMMSMAMGCEILAATGRLSAHTQRFQAVLSSSPLTDFLSAEYFRLKALSLLESLALAPAGVTGVLAACKTTQGFSEFAVASKVDEYMGTAKRTERDKPLSSPLVGLYANAIAEHCHNAVKTDVRNWLKAYGEHLQREPFDIQAFSIRDEDIAFGTDVSPLEILAASFLATTLH